jgi:hypothetical protein
VQSSNVDSLSSITPCYAIFLAKSINPLSSPRISLLIATKSRGLHKMENRHNARNERRNQI